MNSPRPKGPHAVEDGASGLAAAAPSATDQGAYLKVPLGSTCKMEGR